MIALGIVHRHQQPGSGARGEQPAAASESAGCSAGQTGAPRAERIPGASCPGTAPRASSSLRRAWGTSALCGIGQDQVLEQLDGLGRPLRGDATAPASASSAAGAVAGRLLRRSRAKQPLRLRRLAAGGEQASREQADLRPAMLGRKFAGHSLQSRSPPPPCHPAPAEEAPSPAPGRRVHLRSAGAGPAARCGAWRRRGRPA